MSGEGAGFVILDLTPSRLDPSANPVEVVRRSVRRGDAIVEASGRIYAAIPGGRREATAAVERLLNDPRRAADGISPRIVDDPSNIAPDVDLVEAVSIHSRSEGPTAEDPHVLIVDRDPAERAALREVFHREAWNVVEAGTATEAVSVISARRIDAVVTDVELEYLSGLDLVEVASAVYPHPPFVLFVERISPAYDERARRLGVPLLRKTESDRLVDLFRDRLRASEPAH